MVEVLERAGAQQDGPGERGRGPVADGLGRDAQAVAGRAPDGDDHVAGVVHGDHRDRVLVDADHPAQTGQVPAFVRRQQHASGQEGLQLLQRGARLLVGGQGAEGGERG